ncbi:hypothetical protein EXIGLDRAFT_779706 [Exidia glandulosa HHB12029]|uniref:Hydrophobin n=1 Tax=Exidia glandulosa HHB12029 TaxID=1314781 RepID=A0A165BY13_EXIGL|nr:hypothetical protein EXIGLDRAFT_779706 [Exidia glandulosa HHB12029]
MQVTWHFLFIVLTAPVAVHSDCCIAGGLSCSNVMTSPLEQGIFNSAAGVPKGAKNVLSNATFNAIEPLILCCCSAENSDDCHRVCSPGITMTVPDLK